MVRIRRRPTEGGYYLEIADFQTYLTELRDRGIEPPKAEYRVFLSFDSERKLRESPDDWRRPLELFYRLGESSNIPCEFTAE